MNQKIFKPEPVDSLAPQRVVGNRSDQVHGSPHGLLQRRVDEIDRRLRDLMPHAGMRMKSRLRYLQVVELETRRDKLIAELHKLERMQSGLLQDIHTDIAIIVDDLNTYADDWTEWIDARFNR